MGRDWYWGSGAKTSSSRKAAAAAVAAERDQTAAPSGCISAVFHLFDFHHFQFPLNHSTAGSNSCSCFKPDSFYSPDPTPSAAATTTTLKGGTEAPRNSLESEEEGSTTSTSVSVSASASVSLPSTRKEDENLNIPVGIQIKTRGSKVDTSSEISNSPGTKTPTLVARLMGLDLLPESRSPSFSSSSASNFHAKSSQLKHHLHMQYSPKPNFQGKTTTPHRHSIDGDQIRPGTRSLPETPRISSGRRSDVDYHHRFSLQINKENMNSGEELVMSRLSSLKKKELNKHEDENRSPGHYARQIMKQVKESVSRKVGMDITNTVRNREQAREELVNQFKYKKISKALAKVNGNDSNSSPGKLHSTPSSCSPRLRFMESSKTKPDPNPPNPPKPEINIQPPQPIRVSVLPKPKLQAVQEEQEQQPPPRAAAAASKCKKFSSRLKKPQQKQEEPFVRPSTANRVNIPDKKCRKTPLSNDLVNNIKIPQKQVLDAQGPKRRSSQLSSCSSQTYNKQEATHGHVSRDKPNIIGDRCNDAAASSASAAAATTTGDEAEYYEYISRILRRTGFPQADCLVLEDIDALIDKDLPEMKLQSLGAYEEEGEGIVTEIEKDILEALVHETAVDYFAML
ncbi:hypothetical protein COLO4_14229 [Corchorus olitorius]|uniref:DUF3741 domain-containing protein n=1 Tax=Corchorus olitorius TaxID=93759 RepID=A0A1R3JT46_9ROSI|nr:hypothetical protein COLO4_14229 [Corchorus olitorius]